MNNSILLDKNIIIDMITGRPRKSQIINLLPEFDQLFISTNTFTTCFYILRKDYSKEQIYNYMSRIEILEINKNDCHLAYDIAKNIDDIEDCLELFTAKRNKAKIITTDNKLALKYGDIFDIVVV